MYTLIFFLFAAIAIFLISRGLKSRKKILAILGILIGSLTLFMAWFMGFWTEKLWFDQLGYDQRFWIVWLTKSILFPGAFLAGGLFIYLLTFSLRERNQRIIRYTAVLTGGIFSGIWLYSDWDTLLMFINRVSTPLNEPILNMQTGFYLFIYPFLRIISNSFLVLGLIAFGASLAGSFRISFDGNSDIVLREDAASNKSIYVSAGAVLLLLAFGQYLSRFGLMYSTQGVVTGPGWTDVNIRLPMMMIMSVLMAVSGIAIMTAFIRNRINGLFVSKQHTKGLTGIFIIPGIILALWLLTLQVLPALFQRLKVEPNEITAERPYIENNIKFTRSGYHLDNIEEKEFPVTSDFTQETVSSNRNLLNNIRLWDYRALDEVFKQFQEIRLYYEFTDVDVDRYIIGNSYNQVMISAREMETGNLPPESQTFVNKRFKYTHGYGIALNRVSEFTAEGLPNLLVKDIPPVSLYSELKVTRPEIYYGELSNDFVIVNSREEEFDYPSGENNVYTRYAGNGGIEISSLWRKFLFASKYGGTSLLLSGYPTKESRIMIHRNISDRVRTIAPFLSFDDDPYIVLDKGRLFWIIDAYTTSNYYPYSESLWSLEQPDYTGSNPVRGLFSKAGTQMRSINFIRNSVKVIVDAYTGEVSFYTFDTEDPVLQVYRKIFPGLFKDEADMPDGLRKHVRYPADILLIQGLVYSKYHMTDPAVFYNQEDLWVRSTEKYYNSIQPVEPYYIMWKQPGSDKMEYVLILPFTPKDKQVMIGWIAGFCDGDNYGKLLAYQFPKEKRILGTQQVETKIDQDSFLSGQLTLWDQRGSSVIRGNVLAIPINRTIIYVEPIYLQSETSAYPELRLVVLMHDDNLSYGKTFEEALANLFGKTESVSPVISEELPVQTKTGIKELIKIANDAFGNYLDLMQQKKFREAGDALQKLQESLQQLSEENGMK
jgi:uncharacterized membrane protein (UPF0182 family)